MLTRFRRTRLGRLRQREGGMMRRKPSTTFATFVTRAQKSSQRLNHRQSNQSSRWKRRAKKLPDRLLSVQAVQILSRATTPLEVIPQNKTKMKRNERLLTVPNIYKLYVVTRFQKLLISVI